MRVAVIEREGQLACSPLDRGPALGDEIVVIGRPKPDLNSANTTAPALRRTAPDFFVDAAVSAAHGGPTPQFKPITTANYAMPAKRPANSRLDGTSLAERHGVTLPRWQASLEAVVARLIEEPRA